MTAQPASTRRGQVWRPVTKLRALARADAVVLDLSDPSKPPRVRYPSGFVLSVRPDPEAPTRAGGKHRRKDDYLGTFAAHAMAEATAARLGVPLRILGLPDRPVSNYQRGMSKAAPVEAEEYEPP